MATASKNERELCSIKIGTVEYGFYSAKGRYSGVGTVVGVKTAPNRKGLALNAKIPAAKVRVYFDDGKAATILCDPEKLEEATNGGQLVGKTLKVAGKDKKIKSAWPKTN